VIEGYVVLSTRVAALHSIAEWDVAADVHAAEANGSGGLSQYISYLQGSSGRIAVSASGYPVVSCPIREHASSRNVSKGGSHEERFESAS
jgi:hypothetical protein